MSDTSYKVSTVVSFVLSLYGNLRYLVGTTSPFDHGSPFNVGKTPFSGSILVTLLYWAVLYLLQAGFITQVLFPNLNSVYNDTTTKHVGLHFIIFNIGSFLWSILFAKKHFFFAEVILILNLINILGLYFTHKTYSIKPLASYVLVHLAGVALPFSWLLYAVFWNGAVLFHIHKFVGRVVANVLIWDFLIIPGAFVVLFDDWGVGLSSSVLTFGLGFGQLLTKVFALQWIFAFIISAILLVVSLVVAFRGSLRTVNGETAPLLSDA